MSQLRASPRVRAINAFLHTPQYIILMAALTVLGNLLALDLCTYTVKIKVVA